MKTKTGRWISLRPYFAPHLITHQLSFITHLPRTSHTTSSFIIYHSSFISPYLVPRTPYLSSPLQAAYSYFWESLILRAADLDYPDIISQCQKGNRTAQKAVFDHFAPKMLYLCRRYAVDDNEAEDMVQEGFIRLFKNLEKFRNTGSFEGWVRRIFVNTAIKYYHHERNHNGVAAMESVSAFENDETGIVNSISERELMGLLAELPDGYRVVFNLYAVEGYSHAEIAELLNIQESTSRSQLVKARKMLQTKVNELQRVML